MAQKMRMPLSSPGRLIEWFVATGGLFLLTDALDRGMHSVSAPTATLPLARAIVIPFFAAALLLLVRVSRDAVAAVVAAWPVLLMVALAAVSLLWSTDPSFTARWVAGLVGTTIVGVFLAVRFDIDEQLEVVCAALAAVVIASLVWVLLFPQVATRNTAHGFAWLGLFEENNLFGRAMSLSALAFFVLALQRPRLRRAATAGFALSAVALVVSRSLTSLLVACACVIAVAAVVRLRGVSHAARPRALIVAALLALFVLGMLAHSGDRLVAFMGRDATLSGRTQVWSHVLQMVRERPWLGHGYGSFLPRSEADAAARSNLPRSWPLRHPHNGVLEILFELGALGVLCFAVPFLLLLWRAFALALSGASLWPLAYLLFLALINITESNLLRHTIFWALYVAVAVHCRRGSRKAPGPGA
jgi:O-antigen ligase